ncbi:protein MTSS 2 isoform X9 [Narcine bancroftii]|uniref:protein MTSS 2 isoform X9 n=1 Tax=Narcine bancroftii TaxID=1343680 RepID=UPI0038315932
METSMDKECGALGGLFQAVMNDMKGSYPVWEDFNAKAAKLHSQLRTTVLAAAAFLDAFQKVADMATNTRGATRDIGSALTRMCMRHRSIEAKLRHFTNALMESLINPLQERIEDWKKSANQLDKDHAKEYKRARHEIKKKSSDTLKLQKKARKGKGDLRPQVENAVQDVNDMCLLLEEMEKQAVRKALIEERGRFCTFITFLHPVVDGEIAMLGEITHLQAIIDDLIIQTAEPHKLPPASEQVIKDLKGSDYSWSYQTPPSSPSSSSSRKSSMCSSVNSTNSSTSRSSGSQTHSPSSNYRYRSLAQPTSSGIRLSSVSSHDSGFMSQDAMYSKPPSPMPLDITSQHGEEISTAASDLAMVLTRGLSLEHQKSSRDSLQYSSGYSTQTTTPSCSEDTIPSQVSDYDCYSVNGDMEGDHQSEFDRSSTIPRNSDIAQSYRRLFQTKRPASTAGLPSASVPGGSVTPGVATIRRTPSTKPVVRRALSSAGPIPIRPPIVPVKTPTVPDSQSVVRVGSEECVFFGEDSSEYGKASPKRLSLPNAGWGVAGGGGPEISVYPGNRMSSEEQQQLAANRHSLVEKIGELVASAHALGEGQFPFPSVLPTADHDPSLPLPPVPPSEAPDNMLTAIRRGVKLRRTITNDRSAPRIL